MLSLKALLLNAVFSNLLIGAEGMRLNKSLWYKRRCLYSIQKLILAFEKALEVEKKHVKGGTMEENMPRVLPDRSRKKNCFLKSKFNRAIKRNEYAFCYYFYYFLIERLLFQALHCNSKMLRKIICIAYFLRGKPLK
ncbi:hypothetical protein A9C19_10910 [Bacillus weihaiensis]|uniref:Uncharacterized protein n=1 Tax=Bacillus weihaiensis TaxID=1547283 RepID=A0A1L3MS99_9BACI|nr:hypothetical protein A9C19_10910 [Bacillus weihaiensis]